jgi:hypothetical protein
MGVPVYWCDDVLARCWAKALRLASFKVSEGPEGMKGRIECGSISLELEMNRQLAAEWGFPDAYAFALLERAPCSKMLERVLMASGARAIGGTDACRRMFRCSREVATRWPDMFTSIGLPEFVPDGKLHESYPILGYPSGAICRDHGNVHICSGPALDTASDKTLYFLSINFGGGEDDLASSSNVLARDVENRFAGHGIHPIELIIRPPALG